jgi:glyoxylase-like metal-dependent hydrolase (beta-lactamase superfamily II)
MQVFKGIYLIKGYGYDSNVYLVDNELVVDTGSGNAFAEMRSEIKDKCDVTKVKTILNTHNHFDHTGGDQKFRDWLKAEIVIHENDRDALENGSNLAEMFGAVSRTITVDRSLRDKNVIKTQNFSFEVVHTPGHTPGSICLYDKMKKILISGDTLFEDSIGRTDLQGGNKQDMQKSLQRLSKLGINYLLPGHGEPKIGGINFLIKQVLAGTVRKEKFA